MDHSLRVYHANLARSGQWYVWICAAAIVGVTGASLSWQSQGTPTLPWVVITFAVAFSVLLTKGVRRMFHERKSNQVVVGTRSIEVISNGKALTVPYSAVREIEIHNRTLIAPYPHQRTRFFYLRTVNGEFLAVDWRYADWEALGAEIVARCPDASIVSY